MRALVTGGAGFIGSALVHRLAADGHAVRVLDDCSRGRAARLPSGVQLVDGDIRYPGYVYAAAIGCDTIIHLASVQGTGTFYAEPGRVLDTGLRGMLNVLTACKSHKIRRLLVASSSEAYQNAPPPAAENVPLTVPDPLNPRYSYATAKIVSEVLAAAAHHDGYLDDVMIIRPHNVIGPDMGTAHVVPQLTLRMLEEPDLGYPLRVRIQGSGRETRAFCYISDAVDQIVAVLEQTLLRKTSGLGIWNIGSDDEQTISRVVHVIAGVLGRTVHLVPGPLAEGSPLRRCPDISKIKTLGVKPSVSFADAVSMTADWYATHG